MIEKAHSDNAGFRKAAQQFLTHAQETINASLTVADVREMLIQHVLTEEIFTAVFPGTPFTATTTWPASCTDWKTPSSPATPSSERSRPGALLRRHPLAAARIDSHHEKQTFLKIIYENFYKVYNPKAADRLGVCTRRTKSVRFMIEYGRLAVRENTSVRT